MALISLKMPKREKLPTPRGADPTPAGWAAPAPSAPADTGVWMSFVFTLTGFSRPQLRLLGVLEPEGFSLSQSTWLIPPRQSQVAAEPPLPVSSYFQAAKLKPRPTRAGKARGWLLNTSPKAQPCRLKGSGGTSPPCIWGIGSLQLAAPGRRGWKLKLQSCSGHITAITLEKKYLLN